MIPSADTFKKLTRTARSAVIAAVIAVFPLAVATAAEPAPSPDTGAQTSPATGSEIPTTTAAPSAPGPQACGRVSAHKIDVTLDIKGRRVKGTDVITIRPGTDPQVPCRATLYIREGSGIDSIRTVGRGAEDAEVEFTSTHVPEDKARRIEFTISNAPDAEHPISGTEVTATPSTVMVGFSGTFDTIESTRVNIKRGVAFVGDGVMGPEGALLLTGSLWHPQDEDGLSTFDLTVTVPAGYTAVAEGERTGLTSADGTATASWVTDHPVDGLNLVVGRYITTMDEHNGVGIYTFFFEDDDALERTYIEKTREYLDLYGAMFGPYPFKKFAVVENFLPTGYGMPSFTLIGSGILRLPFLPDTSLGHEIAHSWWGNSVYNDPEDGGNWVEALTTYVSDYLYDRRKGEAEAAEFRLRNLRGYRNFAGSVRVSLDEFTDATTPASRVVGYNKGMMVFVMLESLIGTDAFNSALRDIYETHAFSRASWSDLRAAFERAAGEDLGWFFNQWLTRMGGPAITLGETHVSERPGGMFEVTFTVEQTAPSYRLFVPVRITTETGAETRQVMVSAESGTLTVEVPERPTAIELDPDYEVFRIMSDAEIPPTLGGCFGDSGTVIVMPNSPRKQQRYFRLAELMKNDYGVDLTTDADIGRRGFVRSGSVIILGGPGENLLADLSRDVFRERLDLGEKSLVVGGESYPRADTMVAVAIKNPHDAAKTYCMLVAGPEFGDDDHVFNTGRRVRYYSQKSFIVFRKTDNGTKPVTGVLETGSPLKRALSATP